ncbi:DUF5696 domain-containing protein [Zobellia galactanivorans]|uniref:Conserved hypothetical periplasmic protein n=1 Tax=Zobellia galactanivorans (strain DSM 12802 / CCUG 47099 / CIP 106680 / NCIMB 13871 / Dsij) TaxID=63186 RepID=G0L004_ZOBGA|nr:DUF5696 domain-containing protein [Zobellia galactanivorans]5OPQ_A Chain A, 3,6-anhydro-D-galactosidase [Zobellia galactanivorans]5OPQ_B Chain B, 3,6-anhydro-D-galactosidase [Zobellia galactanivorans]5OPQ_C Chain C, 3,6-anhydro-D-galactosidase [Zobellia galactanivorans]5OPQ_D Chain D, 3,6-anhydro-D-galactosidase [Zobellia galactanivorans]CAZ97291.1 Conserved hypothetical periplasmic protein [Zobellia galactanivorans]
MKNNSTVAKSTLVLLVVTCLTAFKGLAFDSISPDPIVLENGKLNINIDSKTGCFSVTEKTSGHVWKSDPWENAAGLLTLTDSKGKKQTVNISKSKKIEVSKTAKNTVSLKFIDPVFEDGSVAKGVSIATELRLDPNNAQLDVEVTEHRSGNFTLYDLRYPARAFSLKTDEDKGAAVIPQKQGVICPSYIFPMNGGRFCKWDDATYNNKSQGSLELFNNGTGLTMPWWGTYNEKSAVMGIVDVSARPHMQYNINNNGQYLFNAKGVMSPYQRIVFLDPIWKLDQEKGKMRISYHFIPGGDYVDMAKVYQKEAKARGHFVSLQEKLKRNPNVNKLPGAIYFGIYGGYPHYVNMPGMAFTFDELKNIIKTIHDDLRVDKAFVHAWGTFSNFVPHNYPISEALGGPEKLKAAVDLAKSYGYLYSSYHAYSPMLENDPNFTTDLMQRDAEGKLMNTGSRWARVDPKFQKGLAQKNIEKEISYLGLEADITDITFAAYRENGKEGRIELAKYIDSFNLVNGTEHGQEQWIPYFDMFEGMTYLEDRPLSVISHPAPLFNLVYHEAIANFGKIQDPDNEVTANGDFRIKALRSMLFGRGTTIFFAPYEFEGMRPMIEMARDLVSPVHKETFYSELKSHEYLSADYKVQRSRFSSGTEVIANLGPVAQKIEGGISIPGYGYRIQMKDGSLKTGHFQVSLHMD